MKQSCEGERILERHSRTAGRCRKERVGRVSNLDYPGLGRNPTLPGVTPHKLEVHHPVGRSQFDELTDPRCPALDKREGVPRVSWLGPVLRGFPSILDNIRGQFYLSITHTRGALDLYRTLSTLWVSIQIMSLFVFPKTIWAPGPKYRRESTTG